MTYTLCAGHCKPELARGLFEERVYGFLRVALNDQSFLLGAAFTLWTLRFWLFRHLVLLSRITLVLVRQTGFAPARVFFEGGLPPDCKSGASAYFATAALSGTVQTVPVNSKRNPLVLSQELIHFWIMVWPSPSDFIPFREFRNFAFLGQSRQDGMNRCRRVLLSADIESHGFEGTNDSFSGGGVTDHLHCFSTGFGDSKLVKSRRFATHGSKRRNRLTEPSNFAFQAKGLTFYLPKPLGCGIKLTSGFFQRGFIGIGLLRCHEESI